MQSDNYPHVKKLYIFAIISSCAVIAIFFSNQRLRVVISQEAIQDTISNTLASPHGSSVPDDNSPGRIITGSRVATIIENRPLDNLVPLILHFSTVLGPDWPIVIFTDPSPPPAFKTSAPFVRLVDAGLISIVPLPDEVKFVNSAAVSTFLTSPWIWEQLAPADHVLLFQADSILCSKSERRVDDFLEYDFIGAPVGMSWGEGFNGGLSLRNRNMMLSLISQSNFTAEMEYYQEQVGLDEDTAVDPVVAEDQWYYKKMVGLPVKLDGSEGAHLPSVEVAASFVVEAIWEERPLGYHQVSRWQTENLAKVNRWCPEWRLIKEGFYI